MKRAKRKGPKRAHSIAKSPGVEEAAAEASYYAQVKAPTKRQRERAAELEAVRMQYYDENRRLRADLLETHRKVDAGRAEIEALKGYTNDQQMLVNLLLNIIKQISPPKRINTFTHESVGQVNNAGSTWGAGAANPQDPPTRY